MKTRRILGDPRSGKYPGQCPGVLSRPEGDLAWLKRAAGSGVGYGLGLSTRTQVTGYQFLARRTAMALTRWRVRMEIEPGRRQTLAVVASVSAALVICLGALLWSFISPSGQLNESPIIADRDSGALYVRVGDRLYPALNLASARLITGRPDNPHLVRSSQIATMPRGPLVGILVRRHRSRQRVHPRRLGWSATR